jgi:hypothetical protein
MVISTYYHGILPKRLKKPEIITEILGFDGIE